MDMVDVLVIGALCGQEGADGQGGDHRYRRPDALNK